MADDVKRVAILGGSTSQLASVVGLPRELMVDTDKKTVRVHDGEKLGGYALLREDGDASAVSVTAAGGLVPAVAKDRWGDMLNVVRDFGADNSGGTATHDALGEAADTGKKLHLPEGIYTIEDAVAFRPGQIIRGDGRGKTVLRVPPTFNMAALGALVCTGGEPGPDFRDLTIEFQQPDTSVRDDLIAYPPAIYAQATPRFRARRLRISGAMVGIDATGNSGGCKIDDLEMGAYDTGIRIDGALDSVRLSHIHDWVFGCTPSQIGVRFDGVYKALELGRCDDVHIDDCMFIAALVRLWGGSAPGGYGPFGQLTGCDFDHGGGLVVEAGDMAGAALRFTVGMSARSAIVQSGGEIELGACKFHADVNADHPLIVLSGGNLGLSGGGMAGDVGHVVATGGTLRAVGVRHHRTPNVAHATPILDFSGSARARIVAGVVNQLGSGSGAYLRDTGGNVTVAGWDAPGWSIDLPATATPAGHFISPRAHIYGHGQASLTPSTAGALGGSLVLQDGQGVAYSGGAVYFGAAQGLWGALKAGMTDGSGATAGYLSVCLRAGAGDATLSEVLRYEPGGQISHRGGATVLVDAASHLGLRSYTVATLPAGVAAGRMIYVSDGGSDKRLAVSDGTTWRWPDGLAVS